jgi:hypothetical protein
MANTTIQILRSYANTAPSSLEDGELAYSFKSNTLFIGNTTNHVIPIGGLGYIEQVPGPVTENYNFDGGTF